MNTKVSKKIATLNLAKDQVITADKCAKIKGGGWYYCCIRNEWIQF